MVGGSNERSGRPLRNQPTAKPVEVWLPFLFPPAGPAGVVEGLDLTGWAPGGLERWLRSSDGAWVGVCNLLIPQSGGGRLKVYDQLVPTAAIRPRR